MNVFSFCIYNSYNPLYYDGLLENIDLIQKHFPSWGIFVYVGNDVPTTFTDTLESKGVTLRFTNQVGADNMIYRFLAIEEPGVELMMVRDADSRVHWRDRWAIREFVKSPFIAHTIRDAPVHTVPMLGGLWGLKRSGGVPVYSCFQHYKENKNTNIGLGNDQNFLNLYIWYRVRHSLLVHTSITYTADNDMLVRFPFERRNQIYCGRVEYPGYIEPPEEVPQIEKPVKIFTTFLNRR